jgi:chlorite dismutase
MKTQTFVSGYPMTRPRTTLTPNERKFYSLVFNDQRQEILRQQIVIAGLRKQLAEAKKSK